MGLVLGKLVHQLPGVVTLAYDLRLTCTIPLQKDLFKEYKFGKRTINPWAHVAPSFPKKRGLGPQNGFGSSGPKKLLKIVNCAIIKETEKLKETIVVVQVEQVGGHKHPPGSLFPKMSRYKKGIIQTLFHVARLAGITKHASSYEPSYLLLHLGPIHIPLQVSHSLPTPKSPATLEA